MLAKADATVTMVEANDTGLKGMYTVATATLKTRAICLHFAMSKKHPFAVAQQKFQEWKASEQFLSLVPNSPNEPCKLFREDSFLCLPALLQALTEFTIASGEDVKHEKKRLKAKMALMAALIASVSEQN